MQFLEFITQETGHRQRVLREEIHPETLDYLRPLLQRTLNTGETVQLPHTAWYLHAQTRDGRLCVSLWWGIADSAPPLTMQVKQSDPPRCTVSTTDSAVLNVLAAGLDGQPSPVCRHTVLGDMIPPANPAKQWPGLNASKLAVGIDGRSQGHDRFGGLLRRVFPDRFLAKSPKKPQSRRSAGAPETAL